MKNVEVEPAKPLVIFEGKPLSLADLPHRFNRRWPDQLRAQLLAAIEGGLLTDVEASARYNLGDNEIPSWRIERLRVVAVVADPTLQTTPSAQQIADQFARLVVVLLRKGQLTNLEAAYVEDLTISDEPFGLEAFLLVDHGTIGPL